MNKSSIAIDFDGVIISKIFGKDWRRQSKKKPVTRGPIFFISKYFETCWAKINHSWRLPIAGSRKKLTDLKAKGHRLILVTSRLEYLREVTIDWMKKWGYFELFDDFYFNDKLVGAVQSKVDNIGKLKPLAHVDDNFDTVTALAAQYPKMKIFFLSEEKFKIGVGNVQSVSEWENIEI